MPFRYVPFSSPQSWLWAFHLMEGLGDTVLEPPELFDRQHRIRAVQHAMAIGTDQRQLINSRDCGQSASR